MMIRCNDRDRIFLEGTPEEWAALEVHAAACAVCGEEMRSWKNLSVAAADLHQEWDSPALWPRIAEALSHNPVPKDSGWRRLFGSWNFSLLQWQTALAGLLLVAMSSGAIWFVTERRSDPIPDNVALFNNKTVREVERAELVYEKAIDRLDAQARPQLENPSTPLMASYREKLLVLDSAISDLRAQAGMNPANGHVRRQLLAMYQEKHDTLEQVLEAKQ